MPHLTSPLSREGARSRMPVGASRTFAERPEPLRHMGTAFPRPLMLRRYTVDADQRWRADSDTNPVWAARQGPLEPNTIVLLRTRRRRVRFAHVVLRPEVTADTQLMSSLRESYTVEPLTTYGEYAINYTRYASSRQFARVLGYADPAGEHVIVQVWAGYPVRTSSTTGPLTNPWAAVLGGSDQAWRALGAGAAAKRTRDGEGNWFLAGVRVVPVRDIQRRVDPADLPAVFWCARREARYVEMRRSLGANLAAATAQPEWRMVRLTAGIITAPRVRNILARFLNAGQRLGVCVGELFKALDEFDRNPTTRPIVLEHLRVQDAELRRLMAASLSPSRRGELHSRISQRLERSGIVTANCSHLEHQDTLVRAASYNRTTYTLCAECAPNQTVVGFSSPDSDGDDVLFRAYATLWPNGTWRMYAPPALIGSYHSGKNVVGFVAPTRPTIMQTPTIGFELEVQAHPSSDDELTTHAQRIRDIVDDELGMTLGRKYLHMEYDGSVSRGFELVSGYTYLDMHRYMLRRLLADNTWTRQLRSHDASCSCGLHVHIAKPASLTHSMRLRAMMNSPMFEPVITAVARRYNTNYCRRTTDSTFLRSPQKSVATRLKDTKGWAKKITKDHVNRVHHSLNGDRYEIINFANEKTVEFRVFRGSLKYATVMSCIEFALAAWRFSRDTPISQMTADGFLEFINRLDNAHDTRSLRPYLKAKGFNARVTRPDPALTCAVDSGESA